MRILAMDCLVVGSGCSEDSEASETACAFAAVCNTPRHLAMHTEREAAEAETAEEVCVVSAWHGPSSASISRQRSFTSWSTSTGQTIGGCRALQGLAASVQCLFSDVSTSATCRCLEVMLPERHEGSA